MSQERRFADLFYNAVTYLGVVIAILVLIIEVFLFCIDFLSTGSNLYIGFVTYLILPGFLFLGLALIPLGVLWKWRRNQKGLPRYEFKSFRIDLAISTHRNALLVFIIGTAIIVLMSLVGSYQAYHYTESVAFCGTLCHKVMSPEYITYLNSPHGKVQCVECHIGPGADWFVKAKLSGLRQVYRTIFGNYSKPIATPIRNLRPAQETCLHCHWPGKFFSSLDFRRTYYLPEKANPKWTLRMSINVGGGQSGSPGVHAHMNIANDIFYVAEDSERQKLTWVKSINKDGKEVIFVSKDSKYKDTPPPADLIRKMDCIDCHNRPSHRFLPADKLMDLALDQQRIDSSLPDIKEQGVGVLSKEYDIGENAQAAIQKTLNDYYSSKYPDQVESRHLAITQAIAAIQDIYSKNIFPAMKARWDIHPDNIGHLYVKGCFRCHDNKHRSADGSVIGNQCNTCHTIIEQGPADAPEKNIDGLEFRHPDGDEEWKTTQCVKCHG